MTVAGISIIKTVIQSILIIIIAIRGFDYLGAKDVDDMALPAIFTVLIVAFLMVLVGLAVTKNNGTKGSPIRYYQQIKNKSGTAIVFDIFCVLGFAVVSEDMFYSLCTDLFDMNFFEGAYWTGFYIYLKDYLLALSIVALVGNILLVFTAGTQLDLLTGSADYREPVYEDPRGRDDNAPPVHTPPVHTPPPPKAEEEKVETVVCPACGFEQPGGRRICWRCSHNFGEVVKPKDVFCAHCGNILDKDARFCGKCGNKAN